MPEADDLKAISLDPPPANAGKEIFFTDSKYG
jgi:hypothetical protein